RSGRPSLFRRYGRSARPRHSDIPDIETRADRAAGPAIALMAADFAARSRQYGPTGQETDQGSGWVTSSSPLASSNERLEINIEDARQRRLANHFRLKTIFRKGGIAGNRAFPAAGNGLTAGSTTGTRPQAAR